MKKIKENIRFKTFFDNIIIFLAIFVFALLINFTNNTIDNDNIWNFNMIQKITLGYMPYKDINMIITPVFHFVGAMFMKIFEVNFITYYAYGSLILATLGILIYQLLKKITNKSCLHLLGLLLLMSEYLHVFIPNYNTFVLIFIITLLLLEDKREKYFENALMESTKLDVIIGMVMGLAILTKQTIGGIFSIVYIIYCMVYDKLKFKKIKYKSLGYKVLGIIIVCFLFLLFLLLTGSFMDFMDLCFGGILDFAEKNRTGTFYTWITLAVLVVSFFCFIYFKEKKEDLKILLFGFFSLTSLTFVIPLINDYHLFLTLIVPTVALIYIINLFFDKITDNKTKLNFEHIIYVVNIIIITYILIISFGKTNDFKIMNIPDSLKEYYGLMINYDEYKKIDKIINYIYDKEKEGYNVYVLSPDAGRYMIPMERNNNKLDLILQGNLGYKGEERLIFEIEKLENVLFLKEEKLIFQESKIVDDYIKENFKEIGKIESLVIYVENNK